MGAVIFGLTYRSFMPQLKEILDFGSLPLNDLLNLSAGLTVAVFALMFVLVLYVIERTGAARKDRVAQTGEAGTD